VVDAPMFKKRLVIEEAEPVMESEETGFLKITKVNLESKS
jgi:diphthamide synthase (EF-2-diphthine--ammonia ligase)